GDCAGAGETRIHVDDLGAVLDLGFHGPAKRYRMVLRHVGSHDDDAVGVGHTPGIESCCAAAETCPQTGDARAVSYPRLILDGNYSQTAHEFLAKMIEFDLKGRAAKGKDPRCHIDELAVGKLFDEGLVARLLRQFGDPVHRPLHVPYLPVGSPCSSVKNLRRAIGIDVELKDRRTLRAEGSLIV